MLIPYVKYRKITYSTFETTEEKNLKPSEFLGQHNFHDDDTCPFQPLYSDTWTKLKGLLQKKVDKGNLPSFKQGYVINSTDYHVGNLYGFKWIVGTSPPQNGRTLSNNRKKIATFLEKEMRANPDAAYVELTRQQCEKLLSPMLFWNQNGRPIGPDPLPIFMPLVQKNDFVQSGKYYFKASILGERKWRIISSSRQNRDKLALSILKKDVLDVNGTHVPKWSRYDYIILQGNTVYTMIDDFYVTYGFKRAQWGS